jgi:hypothetical protein
MPAKDIFHDAVKNALQKDGWIITHDPLFIRFDESKLYIDLAAEKLIAAEKNGQKIAVEVKSFMNDSPMSEFHLAVGKFINYHIALEELKPTRMLYLAVPLETYNSFLQRPLAQKVIQQNQLKFIVYEPYAEDIVKWTN